MPPEEERRQVWEAVLPDAMLTAGSILRGELVGDGFGCAAAKLKTVNMTAITASV